MMMKLEWHECLWLTTMHVEVVGLVWCGGIECDNGDFWVEVECGGNGLNRDLGKR